MELILWRHAEAEEGSNDLQRRLTAKGRQQAKISAAWLRAHLPEQYSVCASAALRSQQTAAYLKQAVQVVPLLNPNARAGDVARLLQREVETSVCVWVGHQPWLGQLCAYLLNGCWQKGQFWSVKKSGFWWFELHFDSSDQWRSKLKAVLSPGLLKKNDTEK